MKGTSGTTQNTERSSKRCAECSISPEKKTSVSMRLWHEADPEDIIEGKTACRLHKELHNKTLCVVFSSPQPESWSEVMEEVD